MNTRIQTRLILVVLLAVLAVPSAVRASTIPVGYVFYQNFIPADGAGPGTNHFYLSWLAPSLLLTDAGFSVEGSDAAGARISRTAATLDVPIDESQPLAGWEFLTTDYLTSAQFRTHVGPGNLTIDDVSYIVTGQDIVGQLIGAPLTPFPFGVDGSGDWAELCVEADPVPVPVPEPATLALTAVGAVLAAARRYRARRA